MALLRGEHGALHRVFHCGKLCVGTIVGATYCSGLVAANHGLLL